MHLYDSVHSYGCDQAHLGMSKGFPNIESACLTELRYDGDFMHMDGHLYEQQTY